MLVERSELTVSAGKEDEFHRVILEEGAPLLRSVDGVTSVQVGKGVENPSKIMLLVGWESMEAHTAYGTTQKASDLRAMMRPYLTSGAMEHFDVR